MADRKVSKKIGGCGKVWGHWYFMFSIYRVRATVDKTNGNFLLISEKLNWIPLQSCP